VIDVKWNINKSKKRYVIIIKKDIVKEVINVKNYMKIVNNKKDMKMIKIVKIVNNKKVMKMIKIVKIVNNNKKLISCLININKIMINKL